MAQRIAKKTVGGVSVWDVHVEVKTGPVTLDASRLAWLDWMLRLNGGSGFQPGMTWAQSLSKLLNIFQHFIDAGLSVFDGVPVLHFLKFSLRRQASDQGPDRHFFCFSTQFDDPAVNEQEYVDDMYRKYGALMEVVWHHCAGLDQLLAKPPDVLPTPPDMGINLPSGFTLSESFLTLVDRSNVDRDVQLCFYNSNPNVSSANVKTWKKDSEKLGAVMLAAGDARNKLDQGDVPAQQVLDELLQAFTGIGV